MWNIGLDESQAGINIVRQNINNLRYADHITLMAKYEEDLGSLDESKRGEWKILVQKTKITASGPITLWHIEGEKVEAVTDFIFLSSKMTGSSSLEGNLWSIQAVY